MTLNQTLVNLCDLVEENDIIVGSFYKRDQVESSLNIGLDIISEDLRFFLTNYYSDGIFYNTNISFCSPQKLLHRQEGYNLDSSKYTVFADVNEDPIVIDKKGRIKVAIEAVDYRLISPSLENFLRIQLEFCKFDLENPNIGPDPENDFESYLRFCEKQLYPIYYRNIIRKILKDEDVIKNYFDFFWS